MQTTTSVSGSEHKEMSWKFLQDIAIAIISWGTVCLWLTVFWGFVGCGLFFSSYSSSLWQLAGMFVGAVILLATAFNLIWCAINAETMGGLRKGLRDTAFNLTLYPLARGIIRSITMALLS